MTAADASDTPPGFKFVGITKDQLWGKFVMDDGRTANRERDTSDRPHQHRQSRIESQAQSRPPVLSVAVRNDSYRQLLGALTLHPDDGADLQRRGLTDAQIAAWGVKSVEQWQSLDFPLPVALPGVSLDGFHLNCQPGYLCPIRDVYGHLVGFQLRLRTSDNGRYRWFTSATKKNPNGATPHLPNGELPIAVHRPDQLARSAIALVEGVGAKPFITAQRRGQIAVGAAGGQFASSPETLNTTLEILAEELGTKTIEFYPDAGAVRNRHVMRQYRATWKLLRKWGYSVRVAWWQQETKMGSDIDELDDLTEIRWLSTAQLDAIAHPRFDWLARIQQTLKKALNPRKSAAALRSAIESEQSEYLPGQRLTVWQDAIAQGYRYLLDNSTPGSGKSYDSGCVEPASFAAKQAIYTSDQHRNPTVETLTQEQGWIDLEARHSGLLREATLGGGVRIKRASHQDTPNLAANCSRNQLLNALRQKYVAGADTASLICGTCPLREVCTHAEGPGYGFLHQRRSALSSPKLRAHLDSLPDPTDYPLDATILLVDEPGQNFRTKRDIQVTLDDLEQTILKLVAFPAIFESLNPLLVALIPLLDGSTKLGRFGIAHAELVAQLPSAIVEIEVLKRILHPDLSFLNTTAAHGVDLADLPRSLRKQFSERDPDLATLAQQRVVKQWLPDLLQILDGTQSGGSLRLGYDGLTLTLPDSRHRSIVQAAKATIFLDATLHPQDLALKLGCSIDEIFVCRQKTERSQNLNLIQVTDLGRLGMQRGNEQQRRADEILRHYEQQEGMTKAIDFKKFASEGVGCWWRDSRGVNDFENVTRLILIGTPCRNLSHLQAEYAVLTGKHVRNDDPQLCTFIDRSILAEFHQAIGRLRAHRRLDTPLEIILLSDFDLDIPTQKVNASTITPNASTKRERFILAVREAVEQLKTEGSKITQRAISTLIPYSQQYVSQHWKLLRSLLEIPNSKTSQNQTPESDSEVVNAAMASALEDGLSNCDTSSQVLETISDIFYNGLEPMQWEKIWNQLSGKGQIKVLAALMLSLPLEQLESLSVEMLA
ncbi:DNA primase [Leptolyngbya sp. NIES-2104]|nr:DNA primase [Leptolyngbya sp. NIES-2104]